MNKRQKNNSFENNEIEKLIKINLELNNDACKLIQTNIDLLKHNNILYKKFKSKDSLINSLIVRNKYIENEYRIMINNLKNNKWAHQYFEIKEKYQKILIELNSKSDKLKKNKNTFNDDFASFDILNKDLSCLPVM